MSKGMALEGAHLSGSAVPSLPPGFPVGRPLPLNSRRLTSSLLKCIASSMHLPTAGSREDLLVILEGELDSQGHESQNVQVVVSMNEDAGNLELQLHGESGPILSDSIVLSETVRKEDLEIESYDEKVEAREELRRSQEEIETLQGKLRDKESELAKVWERVKSLWKANCALAQEFDNLITQKDEEIAKLQKCLEDGGSSTVLSPLRPAAPEFLPGSVVPVPVGVSPPIARRGKAPPVDSFTGEEEELHFEDWLPTFRRASIWNGWSENDSLLQLAGHLRGRALQEWDLLPESEKKSFKSAVEALRRRLERGGKVLAAQDFRHATQKSEEVVVDFIRRLERCFKIAYGRDGLTEETQHALLYAQLHEGLRMELVKAPTVSGAQSYQSLCLAAKNEERRLAEIKKRQQYQRGTQSNFGDKNVHRKTVGFTEVKPPVGSQYRGSNKYAEKTCFLCGQVGHLAYQCRKAKSESQGKQSTRQSVSTRQVTTDHKLASDVASGRRENPLDYLLGDSEDESIRRVELKDKGSVPKYAPVLIQGVPTNGLVDSGADISIMGGDLFKKVAIAAKLKKRDFKVPDKTPKTYDQRPFTLDGRVDLEIEFDRKALKTPVYVKMDSPDPLLLSEGVCRQLGIIVYHDDVFPIVRVDSNCDKTKDSHSTVPAVKVSVIKDVCLLPHQSITVLAQTHGKLKDPPLLIEQGDQFAMDTDLQLQDTLVQPLSGNTVPITLSNPHGYSCCVTRGSVVGYAHSVAVIEPPIEEVDSVKLQPSGASAATVNKLSEIDRCILVKKSALEESNLTPEESKRLIQFLEEFHGIFSLDEKERGETDLMEMKIETGDALPKKVRARRLPITIHQEVAKHLRSMQEAGVIQPSSSAWASPIVMVRKKDGSHRFCVDFRSLNQVTKVDTFPMPRVDDLLDQLGGAKFFTTLDLASGFWQIRVTGR